MMTRCHTRLSAIFLSAFISLPVYSGSVEVAQWVPWKVLTDQILGKTFQAIESKDEYELQIGEFRPKLSNIVIEATGKDNGIVFSEDGIDLSLILEGSLSVSKIAIDQFITREFNGNIIQIRIQAECTGPQINIRRLVADGSFYYKQFKNKWDPEIQSINLELNPSDWNLSSITCQGIGGIGEELTLQIQNALKNPNMFSAMITDLVKEEIKIIMSDGWNKIVSASSQDFLVKEMLRPGLNGFAIIGELKLTSERSEKRPQLDFENLSTTNPQLILSEKGFEALLEDQYLSLSSQKYNLQQIVGFKELMASRVIQYFVWPDLRRFSSNNPFYLKMIPEESRLTLKQSDNSSWNAQINSNGRISTLIGGSEIEYLYIGVTYSTTFAVEIINGEMKIQSNQAELSLAWSYGFLYQLLYKPNPKISTKILKNAVKDSLSNQTITRKLPSLAIDEKEWILQNWKQDKNIITMDWL